MNFGLNGGLEAVKKLYKRIPLRVRLYVYFAWGWLSLRHKTITNRLFVHT